MILQIIYLLAAYQSQQSNIMEKYIFCAIMNVASLATCAWLGYLLEKGCTKLLILVMCVLAINFIAPSSALYTCPKCKHTEKAKVFKTIVGNLPQDEEKGGSK